MQPAVDLEPARPGVEPQYGAAITEAATTATRSMSQTRRGRSSAAPGAGAGTVRTSIPSILGRAHRSVIGPQRAVGVLPRA